MAKERKWIIKEPADPEKVGRLSAELGIDRVLSELLVKRGVETFEQARSFFRPSLDNLHDPFLMKDMDAAVKRVRKAITSEEKILVYGIMTWTAPQPWRWCIPSSGDIPKGWISTFRTVTMRVTACLTRE